MTPEPPLFVLWYDFSKWLLGKTEKFPKKVRFSFTNRIDNLALDIIEGIVEARYSGRKKEILQRVDLDLEKLRILLRICHDQSGLDHFVKEHLRIEGYVRYMDDQVLWADEKDTLWDAASCIQAYLDEKLFLRVKPGTLYLAPVLQGLPFLGFRIFPGVLRIARPGWRRFRRKVKARSSGFADGAIDSEQWTRSMASMVGYLQQADTRNLRASFFNRPGAQEAPTG